VSRVTKRHAKRARKKARGRPATTTDMDDHPSAVLAAYGHTMLVWQILEQHLGQLWVMSLIGEHELGTDRSVKRDLRRSIHAATKATARESFRGLEASLDQELHSEIDAAIKWRDVLAHRYLRERLRGGLEHGHFMAGTSAELGELYDRFVSLAIAVEAIIVAEEDAMADEIAALDDELIQALTRVGRALLRKEPLREPG
jgi:hypothetical protein